MNNLTLIIPAKHEKESLAKVLDELKPYNWKIVVVLEKKTLKQSTLLREKNCEILTKFTKVMVMR